MLKIYTPLAVLLLLAGCTAGPSEQDIQQAVAGQYAALNGFMGNLTNGAAMAELHSVEKVGCEKARDNVYVCDVVIDSTAPLVGRSKTTQQLTMMRTRDGWQLDN